MSKYEALRVKLAKRENVNGTTITFFNEPMLTEKLLRDNLDFLIFDMEHGRFNAESLRLHLYICRQLDIPSLVRVQDTEYHLIAKAVDMGADGIVLPRAETPEQIQKALDALYFYPIGQKGFGGYTQLRKGEGYNEFQRGRFLMPQIESPKGIENLPAMLKEYSPYISGMIVGPYDMSVMVGTPRDIYSDVMLASIKNVIDICREYNVSSGVYCNNIDEASVYHKMGANIFWFTSDLEFFLDGYNRAFDALSNL